MAFRLYDLQIQIQWFQDNEKIEIPKPTFIWKAPIECRQFTIELAKDIDFEDIIFLRDTNESYYLYDGSQLEKGKMYFLRVRSGAGPWSIIHFTI